MIRLPSTVSRRTRTLRRAAASHAATLLALLLAAFNAGFLAATGLLMLLEPSFRLPRAGVACPGSIQRDLVHDVGLIQIVLAVAFALGLARPELRVGLWLAATFCLAAQAGLPWGGPLGTLPAAHGLLLSLWAIGRAPVIAKPRLHGAAGGF